MSFVILDSKAQVKDIGVNFRSSRSGPEEDLIQHFLHGLHIHAPYGCNVTLFREPKLESGVPDIVIVVWTPAKTDCWDAARQLLDRVDIRVLHYISSANYVMKEEIESIFGNRAKAALAKLMAAQMIQQHEGYIKARPISEIYAITHIIAVEAKVAEWRGALEQAFHNLWFASASYVLLSHVPRKSMLEAEAITLGIGIKSKDDTCWDVTISPSQAYPVSYASWLFNEWVWRASVNSQSTLITNQICNGSQPRFRHCKTLPL